MAWRRPGDNPLSEPIMKYVKSSNQHCTSWWPWHLHAERWSNSGRAYIRNLHLEGPTSLLLNSITIYESCISKLFALKMIDGLAAMHTIRGPNSRRLEPLTSWLRTGGAYMMVDCVIIGPGDWFGINPLPEHVLTYCQLKTQEQTLARELLNGKVFNKQSSCRRFGTP